MKITIIIPVYNEEKYILKILNQVNEQRKIGQLEIIVVDDNSSDKTKAILNENPNLYDLIIFKDKNEGKGSAIITGINNPG